MSGEWSPTAILIAGKKAENRWVIETACPPSYSTSRKTRNVTFLPGMPIFLFFEIFRNSSDLKKLKACLFWGRDFSKKLFWGGEMFCSPCFFGIDLTNLTNLFVFVEAPTLKVFYGSFSFLGVRKRLQLRDVDVEAPQKNWRSFVDDWCSPFQLLRWLFNMVPSWNQPNIRAGTMLEIMIGRRAASCWRKSLHSHAILSHLYPVTPVYLHINFSVKKIPPI